jgi:hypothetical protein
LVLTPKLKLMEMHFLLRWQKPLEDWAGQEGGFFVRAGCLLLLCAGVVACVGWFW